MVRGLPPPPLLRFFLASAPSSPGRAKPDCAGSAAPGLFRVNFGERKAADARNPHHLLDERLRLRMRLTAFRVSLSA
jgi:hypothetical protein